MTSSAPFIEYRPVYPNLWSRLLAPFREHSKLLAVLLLIAICLLAGVLYAMAHSRKHAIELEITELPATSSASEETSSSKEADTSLLNKKEAPAANTTEETKGYTPLIEGTLSFPTVDLLPHQLLAFMRLEEAFYKARPFGELLDELLLLAPQDHFLQKEGRALTPYMEKGVTDLFTLQTQFEALAGKTVAASKDPAQLTGKERLLAKLSPWLRIRRIDSQVVGEDHPEGWVRKAEILLEKQELEEAVTLLSQLPPASKAILKEWLALAEARIQSEQHLRKIKEYLAMSLHGKGAP